MKKVLVIGGGLAGLTAASILTSKNYSVTVLEASPKLGGRTYSFTDNQTNSIIDNGQHILMGCYQETLAILKLIGAEKNFDYQKNLKIDFLTKEKKVYSLNADKLIYPLNLLYAIFNFNAMLLDDKIKFISFILKLPFQSKRSLQNLNVIDWLIQNNQTPNSIKVFWEILCIGAMNTSLFNASAVLFHTILIEIFFKGNYNSTIILPKYDLTESIIKPAEMYITKNGGSILTSERVNKLKIINDKISEVKTEKTSHQDFDFVISAIPLYQIEKIIDRSAVRINLELNYSAIINIHIWSDEFNFSEKFFGLLDSPLHWIFKKSSHINVVISNANNLVEKSKEEIFDFAINELSNFLNFNRERIKSYKIVKEKRATFIPDTNKNDIRPLSKTKIKNFFLAGDWINTGLPSTIEGAVKSGRIAAENILNMDTLI